MTEIQDVRCVRTVRLGLPNTALLPYKMGGSLQRLLAVRGMGRDPQRREMGDAGPGARDWQAPNPGRLFLLRVPQRTLTIQ